MSNKNRVLALIDGFNFYHKLKEYEQKHNVCVKWLNYRSLIESWLNEYDDKNNLTIIYFSAIAYHRHKDSVNRHITYIKALDKVNIQVVLGEFKDKRISKCSNCPLKDNEPLLIRHEEKNTDVNIAITLVNYALNDKFDKCFLLSADNDFLTAIQLVKEEKPNKKIIICPPPTTNYYIDNLIKASKSKPFYITWSSIKKNQFPDKFEELNNPWKKAFSSKINP